jgi:hypothetical protein
MTGTCEDVVTGDAPYAAPTEDARQTDGEEEEGREDTLT